MAEVNNTRRLMLKGMFAGGAVIMLPACSTVRPSQVQEGIGAFGRVKDAATSENPEQTVTEAVTNSVTEGVENKIEFYKQKIDSLTKIINSDDVPEAGKKAARAALETTLSEAKKEFDIVKGLGAEGAKILEKSGLTETMKKAASGFGTGTVDKASNLKDQAVDAACTSKYAWVVKTAQKAGLCAGMK